MPDEVRRQADGTIELPPPPFVLQQNPTKGGDTGRTPAMEAAALALLDRMITGIKKEAIKFTPEMVFSELRVPPQDKKSPSGDLTARLKESYKDTWDLLPKDYQEALVKMQEALTSADLGQLVRLAKELRPEVAEKMAALIEKNLREQGAKVHFKSADGEFLWYRDNAKTAIRIGSGGKASVVAIEANEPDGPPDIKEGIKPFKSLRTLAHEIADSTMKDLRLKK